MTPVEGGEGTDPLIRYRSHPQKLLRRHIDGVVRRTVDRTDLPIARAGALLHDVGKINLNFQAKLDNQKTPNYSNHAYLSAATLLRLSDGKLKCRLHLLTQMEKFALALIVARHHGNLPNCNEADRKSGRLTDRVELCLKQVFRDSEYQRMLDFLNTDPDLPLAQVTAALLDIPRLALTPPVLHNQLRKFDLPPEQALDFFLETQFAFASLIESDKRDASDNEQERRREHVVELSRVLKKAETPPKRSRDALELPQAMIRLNTRRTRIRNEALKNLDEQLRRNPDRRVFSLTAPTGAGKTLTLLALASLLLRYHSEQPDDKNLRGVIYCLPFLSITEQVEGICRGLLGKRADILLLRADSRADNPALAKILAETDDNPEAARQLLREVFAETVFDSPLIVTTFVQFFESLMNNRNSALLKLPNFARSVILIDEIQALPPRLYAFFAAYLDAFCRRFNAYAILSTATMPSLDLPSGDGLEARNIFTEYCKPPELLSRDHFKDSSFQRYEVVPRWDVDSLDKLSKKVMAASQGAQGQSVLVILNTISDTVNLFEKLKDDVKNVDVLLLNTRFIPFDRKAKIAICDEKKRDKPLIVVTTQLVEAGVDIDFPVVFRDFCPIPSLIQSAGRCNRNNRFPNGGTVFLVQVLGANGKPRAQLVYDSQTATATPNGWYLNFTRDKIQQTLSESQLLGIQEMFFEEVNRNMQVGYHPGLRGDKPSDPKSNLLLCVRDAAFEDAGKLRLIQQQGEQFGIYVPQDAQDTMFGDLAKLANELVDLKKTNEFQEVQVQRARVEAHLRKMADRTVQARLTEIERCRLAPEEPVYGIYRLGDPRNYTAERGLCVADDANIF